MRTNEPKFLALLKTEPLRNESGQLFFIEKADSGDYDEAMKSSVNRLKSYLKNWPAFYYFLLYFASTIFFGGLSVKKALKKSFPDENYSDKVILNLGSGPRRHHQEIINIDAHPFLNVDIVADALNLPFRESSVDMVIAESLLEHLPEPQIAVREIMRVLKPGGHVYILIPFLYPFHASPDDFHRWTVSGIRRELKEFEEVDVGMRSGPVSAFLSTLMHLLASVFSLGSEKLYILFVNIFMMLLAPFKIFDWIFFLFPKSIDAAAFIYYLGKKKNG